MECESCVYAAFFEDRSVGIEPYVEDCKRGSRAFETDFEDGYCAFYIKQLVPDKSLNICPICNSRKNELIKFIEEDFSGKFKCLDCGNIFIDYLCML